MLAILQLNPMTHIIEAYHAVLYYKVAPNMVPLGILALSALVFLAVAEFIFIKLEQHFAEEL